MMRSLDIWRTAIINASATEICTADLSSEKITWLPRGSRFTFRADPFGVWHSGRLNIFVEKFDYRLLRGVIELLVYDKQLCFVRSQIVLSKAWHLSYPFVLEAEGQLWMLPEARESGSLTIYRATCFPNEWEPAGSLDLDGRVVDATPVFYRGRWWLFYGRGGRRQAGGMELHAAFSDALKGPWSAHPRNPLRRGFAGTRPAGTPQLNKAGELELPVQDCTRTYGGSLKRLRISRLDDRHFEAEEFPWLEATPALAPYTEGVHTVSAAGHVTLIDCKLIDRSIAGNIVHFRGRLHRRYS
jgi:hypothetical protein